ncbi:MAG TPA: hypothetical protein VHP32_06585 [Ignavibacteria bacterium]|jgi:hypothetical protein|nr:hypothetical protein [Ignavibacteria bacterium]
MNKYRVVLPYQYATYGEKTGFVYAEDQDEAEDMANEEDYLHEEDYRDSDDTGSTEYNYSDMTIELYEEDVPDHLVPSRNTYHESHSAFNVPVSVSSTFLEDLPALQPEA